MPTNTHANTTLHNLREAEANGDERATESIEDLVADHDTYPCVRCGKKWLTTGDALACCSDMSDDSDPDYDPDGAAVTVTAVTRGDA